MDKKYLHVFALRFGLAVTSSGVFAFLTQIAVFRYTRYENAPIPAGEIIGLSSSAAGAVIGTLWLCFMLGVLLIKVALLLIKLSDNNLQLGGAQLESNDEVQKILIRWGLAPLVGFLIVWGCFLAYPHLTGSLLKYLGYGGRISVCQSKIINGKYQLGSEPTADLILLTHGVAYVQVRLPNDQVEANAQGEPENTWEIDGVKDGKGSDDAGYIRMEIDSLSAPCH